MVSKRTAEDQTEWKAPKNKRHRTSRTDPTSGQRGAFGDLGGATTAPAGDSDLDCEDDSEALAYLRSVRTEASTIPHVLAAKKAGPSLPPHVSGGNGKDGEEQQADRTLYDDGVGDFRGYYHDGAYVACPDGGWDEGEGDEEYYDEDFEENEQDEAKSESDDDPDASESAEDRPRNSGADEIRDAYFTSITNQYLALRKILQAEPPDSALHALPATNPTEVGEWKRGVDTFQRWEGRLRGTDPLPAQIAAMHKDSVFRLLRVLLACKFLRKRTQLRERTSRWIWALLARLPDGGELDYMEVGWIRELGKRAVLLMVSLAELEVLREHYDVAGSGPDDQDEYEADIDVDDCFDEDLSQDLPIDVSSAPTPEDTGEHVEHDLNPNTSITRGNAHQAPHSSTNPNHETSSAPLHTQSPDNASDVEMQLDSDMEDGEVADEPPTPLHSDPVADIETAKARLLARLNDETIEDREVKEDDISASVVPVPNFASTAQSTTAEEQAAQTTAEHRIDEGEEDAEYERYQELDRTKINERATLNMILTVAGEFYGQRDLLEFRDPFGGLQFE
ncbi:hypothetical protein E0Z10_g5116 [Xylaria hypoxylon]|uniref:Uncharacterized protein n=1 Tax=Xylaria hypoxylon TaxID=37992 RepID=A0A4Z0YUP7_9PEZI|nr:hypothetical protein E0Z10_g5116 [Xylaria hypoxylon]